MLIEHCNVDWKLTRATCNCFRKIDVPSHQKFNIFVFKLLYLGLNMRENASHSHSGIILKYEFVFIWKKVEPLGNMHPRTFARRFQIDNQHIAMLQSNIAMYGYVYTCKGQLSVAPFFATERCCFGQLLKVVPHSVSDIGTCFFAPLRKAIRYGVNVVCNTRFDCNNVWYANSPHCDVKLHNGFLKNVYNSYSPYW